MNQQLPISPDEVKRVLGLEPHPREGGWFVQTYRSEEMVAASGLDARYGSPRSVGTAIYYLLEPGTFSEMHRLRSDEIFHHYAGGAVEMLQLLPGGGHERIVIGKDLLAGERPQVLVPHGVWQGSRLVEEEGWALLGCTVSPGFEYGDYETGYREGLTREWPAVAEMIQSLTRK